MATDAQKLLIGLRGYHDHLMRHLQQLQEEYTYLEARWRAFSVVYEGEAANRFRLEWERTTASFRDYVERGRVIAQLLIERIAALERVNLPEGGI